MKKFLKKKWHRISVVLVSALLALVLVAGGAFAFAPVTQTVTQEITGESSISVADPLVLDSVMVGKNAGKFFPNAVMVYISPDDAGKYLHVTLDEDSTTLYDQYKLILTTEAGDVPAGSEIVTLIVELNGVTEASALLTAEGTYTFTEAASYKTGSTGGTANVIVTFTLENEA